MKKDHGKMSFDTHSNITKCKMETNNDFPNIEFFMHKVLRRSSEWLLRHKKISSNTKH